jgi:exosortase
MIGRRASQAWDRAKFHLGLKRDANPGFRTRRSAPIPDDGQGTAKLARARFHLGLILGSRHDEVSAEASAEAEARPSRRLALAEVVRFFRVPAWMLAAGVLLALFGLLTWHLLFFWEVNPQYSYGWLVPGLAIYLLLRRWDSRPYTRPAPRWTWPALIACLIVLAPIWLIREAIPDWSVVSWLLALTIVAALLLTVCQLGGTPWLTHFAFPFCFILSAVPWPQRIELAVVQGLMRFVADKASEILCWIDIAAFSTGNLIRLASGSIAVDEACSGIRSLQAMLMISLFLGEFCNLNIIRRAVLIAAAVGTAILLNLARATALVFVFARWGVSIFDAWHDPTGHALFIAGLFLLSGLAFLLKRSAERSRQPWTPQSLYLKMLPPLASAAILLWLAAIVSGTELWYASNEKRRERTTLEVVWPTTLPGYKELAVPGIVRQVLLSSSGRMAIWRDGCQWSLATFYWRPGRTAPQSARMHRPDTCLQASGAALERELGSITVALGQANLRFKSYLFSLNGQPLFVFFTIWEEANLDAESRAVSLDWSGWSRVQRAFARQRNLGQQSLEFFLYGTEDYAEAVRMFKGRLPELVRCLDVE